MTSEEIILAFDIPREELDARRQRLQAVYGANSSETRSFSLERQLHAYNVLGSYEKACLANYFIMIEVDRHSLAFYMAKELFGSAHLRRESIGLLAFAAASATTGIAPLASIITHATPFSQVADDDWAYYLALAIVKLKYSQPRLALQLIELAELVLHHHTASVARIKKDTQKQLKATSYNLTRALPKLLTRWQEIATTFLDAEDMMVKVSPLIEQLKIDSSSVQQLNEDNLMFRRLAARAGRRYYHNDWQILDDPAPQPGSSWSKLPNAVIKHMACVVNWKEYLALASTCKSYHNQMNSSAVWLHVLDKKWDLDVTFFDEGIPRNPVLIVAQINDLFSLNKRWWLSQNSTLSGRLAVAPFYEVVSATTRNLLEGRSVLSHTESTTDAAACILMCVISGDRSGKLTGQLIENGILDYLINSVRTDVINNRADLTLSVLSLLYIRSRASCVAISRYLPEAAARALAISQMDHKDRRDTALGMLASITASHVMYPGAHVLLSKPKLEYVSAGDGVVATFPSSADDLILPSNSLPGDFQSSPIEHAYMSLVTTHQIMSDELELPDPSPELNADKRHLNLDHVPIATWNPKKSKKEDYSDSELSEAAWNAINSHDESTQEYSGNLETETQAFSLTQAYADKVKRESERYERLKPFELPLERLIDRFASAEEEWQLYIVFSGIYFDSVLHQGLLRMKITIPESKDGANVTGDGYWTIGEEETLKSMANAAVTSTGRYVSQSSDTSQASNADKTMWKEEHQIKLESGGFDLAGVFSASIARKNDGTLWKLFGSGFPMGYSGGIKEERGDDEEENVIGSFLLLKPDCTHPDAVGKLDLGAFTRLAHLPLKVGPYGGIPMPVFPAYCPLPRELRDDEAMLALNPRRRPLLPSEENTDLMIQTSTAAARFVKSSINDQDLIGEVLLDQPLPASGSGDAHWIPAFEVLFVPDPANEMPGSTAQIRRRGLARDHYAHLTATRIQCVAVFVAEYCVDLDFISEFVDHPFTHFTEDECFSYRPESLPISKMDAIGSNEAIEEEEWSLALEILHKWTTRLCLFELAGLDPIRALKFLQLTFIKTTNRLMLPPLNDGEYDENQDQEIEEGEEDEEEQ